MDKICELKKCVKSITIEAEKFFLRNNKALMLKHALFYTPSNSCLNMF